MEQVLLHRVERRTDLEGQLGRRLFDAIEGVLSSPRYSLDAAVLIRQAIRHVSEAASGDRVLIETLPIAEEVLRAIGSATFDLVGVSVDEAKGVVSAASWKPAWVSEPDLVRLDQASAAGSPKGRRAFHTEVRADSIFTKVTGYPFYRGRGQQAAVRAALTMPAGDSLIVSLPTGIGKTEIALTLAEGSVGKTTVFVVPTTALALDMERRFRATLGRKNPRLANLPFAWHSDTSPSDRVVMEDALRNGHLPILVTSPEALTDRLRRPFLDAAKLGQVAALIIDEAHLVTQWGRSFRPDFRELSEIRRVAVEAAVAFDRAEFALKTLLLSATLGTEEILDLSENFETPGKVSLVAASELRPEIDIFTSPTVPGVERERRVFEALLRLPRPAILYLTKPADAISWERRLRKLGFNRVGLVTGQTAGDLRQDVLDGLRTLPDHSTIDVVVATAAFGVGIDNDEIRTVIHACIPDSVDRWYQEMGRSGRDGHQSVGLLIPSESDIATAASQQLKALSPEIAYGRWKALWESSVERGRPVRRFMNLQATARHDGHQVERGSHNYKWNSQILQSLREEGVVRTKAISFAEARELELVQPEQSGTRQQVRDSWIEVDVRRTEVDEEAYWEDNWVRWAERVKEGGRESFQRIQRLSRGDSDVCSMLRAEYLPSEVVRDRFGDATDGLELHAGCGRCPECRNAGLQFASRQRVGSWHWNHEETLGSELRQLMSKYSHNQHTLLVGSSDVVSDGLLLADALASRNLLRYFVGVSPEWQPPLGCFVDENSIGPYELSPLPGFVVANLDNFEYGDWAYDVLRPRDSLGMPYPLILLVDSRHPKMNEGVRDVRIRPITMLEAINGGT